MNNNIKYLTKSDFRKLDLRKQSAYLDVLDELSINDKRASQLFDTLYNEVYLLVDFSLK